MIVAPPLLPPDSILSQVSCPPLSNTEVKPGEWDRSTESLKESKDRRCLVGETDWRLLSMMGGPLLLDADSRSISASTLGVAEVAVAESVHELLSDRPVVLDARVGMTGLGSSADEKVFWLSLSHRLESCCTCTLIQSSDPVRGSKHRCHIFRRRALFCRKFSWFSRR